MLPKDIVLVRHGQSEGNVASHASEAGDHRFFTPEHRDRHNSAWRLTDDGVKQAQATGEWLRSQELTNFDRYMSSEYLRCIETAAHLGFQCAEWFMDYNLRERDYGLMDVVSDHEKKTAFANHHRQFGHHRFYANLPDGETMARLAMRLSATVMEDLQAFGNEHPDGRVLIVSHGGTMRAFQTILERKSGWQYHAEESESPTFKKINNCQVLHYTRANPFDASDVRGHMAWTRSVCPWDTSRSSNEWRPIIRPRYTNADLLALAASYPRLIHENE